VKQSHGSSWINEIASAAPRNDRLRIVFLLILVSLSVFSSESSAKLSLKTECSKTEIFQGENTLCEFILYSEEPFLIAEVAKFPEFRGFWSENRALTQGQIQLIPKGPGNPMRFCLIGAYLITPIVKKGDSQIIGMKLIVRTQDAAGKAAQIILESEPPALKIKQLPPAPAGKIFSSAVGQFFLEGQDNISYKNGEPVSFQLAIRGEGNFPEINRIPLKLPEGVELVSERSFLDGITPTTSKFFEYTVIIRKNVSWEWPAIEWSFFNPPLRQYQTVSTKPIHFKVTIDDKIQANPFEVPLRPPSREGSLYSEWGKSPLYWILLLIAAFLILYEPIWFRLKTKFYNFRQNPTKLFRKRRRRIERQLTQGDITGFLKEVDSLIFEELKRTFPGGGNPSIKELLAFAHANLPQQQVQSIERLFQLYRELTYSPESPEVPQPDYLLSLFKKAVP
jgi:hypothetical protein